jgi:hypothetical protein
VTDKEINEAAGRFQKAMAVVQETLPVLRGAHLDEVPAIAGLIKLHEEAKVLEDAVAVKRKELQAVLQKLGVHTEVRPVSRLGAQVLRLVGWHKGGGAS